MNSLILTLTFAAAVSFTALLRAAEQQASKPDHVNYARPFERPTRPALKLLIKNFAWATF